MAAEVLADYFAPDLLLVRFGDKERLTVTGDRQALAWHELRLTVPADASVIRLEQPEIAVSSLRVYGPDVADCAGSTFWVMAARQTLSRKVSLDDWSASIVDAAGQRRTRVRRRLGAHDVIVAEPSAGEPIGTFIFAVVNQHGFNIMTGAALDPASQAEIAAILETLHFEEAPA